MNAQTPHLTVSDPRGLTVRSVDYCRTVSGSAAESRVHHALFDASGRLVEQRDPRLWALPQAPANLATVHSLSGQVVRSDGVDNGFCCDLWGEAGQVLQQWDGRGQRRVEYDALLRPLAVFERLAEQAWQCSERFDYADDGGDHGQHNRCGRLLRHDDPAGTCHWPGFSLTGEASHERRRFLDSTDWPDWPVDRDARDVLLEPGEGASTCWRHGPLEQVLEQTDAGGHRQVFESNLSGEPSQVCLQLLGQAPLTLLGDARYDARGRMLEALLGNGLTSLKTYDEADGRLTSLVTRRANGETLQDIHYGYDPAGNVTSLEDHAQPLRHFANQRIEPRCEYRYDSLYQLIEATGWESGAASRGPGTLLDPGAVSNYRQTYRYDAGGNLLELTHVGAQSHGRVLSATRHGNRCLQHIDGRPPTDGDFLDRFDANGNLLELHAGQRLSWDVRNRLSNVHSLTRNGGADDIERYAYDAAGQRLRKWRSITAGRHSEVRYLPGLELHDNPATAEQLQVVTVQAGSCCVRVLHWLAGRPDEVVQDQQRYALGDHLGSHALELDQVASLISHEVFHPFGSTAWRAARSDVEASYKTLRYSGKERDATGLYYYGARYYMPWLQRWLSPDPAGALDGLNLYCMVRNSPINHQDRDGRQGYDVMDDVEMDVVVRHGDLLNSSLDNFPPEARDRVLRAARLARSWVRNTRRAFRNKASRTFVNEALASTFGEDTLAEGFRSEIKHGVSRALRGARDYLSRLSQDEGWRVHLADLTNKNVLGYTVFSDVNGPRIVLNQAAVYGGEIDLAGTMLHESLHATTTTSNTVVDSHSIVDFWYSVPEMSTMGDGPLVEAAAHLKAREVLGTGPGEREESTMPSAVFDLYVGKINQVTDFLGLPRAEDSAKRNEYFRSISRVRKAVTLYNADSITGVALMFRNHKS